MCAPLKYKVEGILDNNGAKLPLKKRKFQAKNHQNEKYISFL